MIIDKGISPHKLFKLTWFHVVWLFLYSSLIASLYYYKILKVQIPWLAVSVIGTAVAFYVGFKNNSAYARMWEARKVWGAIVNTGRAWGTYVDGFITSHFLQDKTLSNQIDSIKQRLIYRQIAWLYILRNQLLIVAPWEHANQKGHIGKTAKMYQKNFGIGLVDDEVTKIELKDLLPLTEYDRLLGAANAATQIINEQARDLEALRKENYFDDFRHVELMKVLYDFYDHQGKCERIKKFPLPRQYANVSRYFVGIFIFLFPFSLVPELLKLAEWGLFLSVVITTLIGWVYVMMEITGDYTENPFQGMANDIPMLSLCRTIEIDLRQMLREETLPEVIKPKKGILM